MEDFNNNVISRELQTENDYGINTQKYYSKGLACAVSSALTNPESVTSGLDEALGLFRQDSVEITRKRVQKLEADIKTLNERKDAKEAELKNCEQNLGAKERQKEELIKERDNLEKESGITSSLTPLIVLGVSLFLLTAFVFAFYYYVGRVTIVPIVSAELGIMQSVKPLSILFPFLVFAFGVTIHLCLTKIKNNEIWGKIGWASALLAFLAIVLSLDAVMGLEMSKNAHTRAIDLGHRTDVWQNSMIWESTPFYIVLILGFVGYLVWGILLSNFLNHPNFNKPEEIKKLNQKIFDITDEIETIKLNITKIKNEIENLLKEITAKQTDLNNYKSGGSVYYNITFFKMVIGKFMGGYKSYVTIHYERDENDKSKEANDAREKATGIIDRASKKQEEWINQTITKLQQEV